ncbi:MAG TPA: hybrid sensor histidine kinase/response regulator [Spirochaeta sp.]|nr:hybrid sensor histidine kinase/response regulator [Spirochaeta sp.]
MSSIDLNDETLLLYLEESREHLADIESSLLDIEEAGANIDEELVNKVFRAAHSIKGGAGFFNLVNIRTLGHKIENVLDMIRGHEMVPSPEIINILLLSFDKLRELVNSPEASNEEDIGEFVESLINLTSETLPEEKKETVRNMVDINLPDGRTIMQMTEFDYNRTAANNNYIYLVEFDLMHDLQSRGIAPLDFYRSLIGTGTIEDSVTDFEAVGTLDDRIINRIPVYFLFSTIIKPKKVYNLFEVEESRITIIYSPEGTVAEPDVEPKPVESEQALPPEPPEVEKVHVAAPAPAEKKKIKAAKENTGSLRVKIALLERLMNLAGELVLSRNELEASIVREDLKAITNGGQRVSQVTTELQEAIMLTRMQEIGSIFNKFPRVVRDMSRQLEKKMDLIITGKEVELDKTLIEGLNDPLTHMIRNAVDHGIELPDVRSRAGKNETGKIELKAYYEAGQVVIEITDDGKGIDGEIIASKAVSKGLISQSEIDTMSSKAKTDLIMLPGFSTAEKVTDVSGRGVGMDVVRTNLEQLGGIMDINSTAGKGSVFRIKLPLTLAIIPSLLVSTNRETFAIPQLNVEELIRIEPGEVKNRIERLGNTEILNLRGKLIPVVFLSEVLGIKSTYIDSETGEESSERREKAIDRRADNEDLAESEYSRLRSGKDRRFHAESVLNIVIVSSGNTTYGILVDSLHETMEIVVKPLGRQLKKCKEYAGATIMGNGNVALILDVAGIANMLEMSSVAGSLEQKEAEQEIEKVSKEEKHAYLLFRSSEEEYCAMPLELVARVEQIEAARIEQIGGKRIIQYLGRGLPLVSLADVAGEQSVPEDNLAAIVFHAFGRDIGLLAIRPVDFIEQEMVIDHTSLRQKGVMGSVIIDGRTTMIVDVHEIVEAVYPDLVKNDETAPSAVKTAGGGKKPLILVAEDSAFFRKQVVKYFEEAGYKVLSGEDGEVAWKLLAESTQKVDLLVTDIEMPNLDGYGLVSRIRADSKYADLPIIAVTSLAGDENIEKGKAVGINDYQVKLDKDALLKSVNEYLAKRR